MVVTDTAAPSASVTAEVQNDDVFVTWTASEDGANDSGLAACTLEVTEDGAAWQPLSNDCSGSITDSNVQAGRTYEFRLDAADQVGNSAQATDSLVYQGVVPQVSLSASADGTTIALTWSASDSHSGLATCALEVQAAGSATWTPVSADCSGAALPYEGQPRTSYTFRLTATDQRGNTNSTQATASTSSAITKYYYFGARRVAMRGADGAVVWLHGDHLGSTSLATSAGPNPQVVSRQLYYPFGQTRWASDPMPTDFGFTGQREQGTIGLYDYHARFYDPFVGRFIQADTIVPNPGNPQAFNRYSYVNNRPLLYIDPTGRAAVGWDPGYGAHTELPPPQSDYWYRIPPEARGYATQAYIRYLGNEAYYMALYLMEPEALALPYDDPRSLAGLNIWAEAHEGIYLKVLLNADVESHVLDQMEQAQSLYYQGKITIEEWWAMFTPAAIGMWIGEAAEEWLDPGTAAFDPGGRGGHSTYVVRNADDDVIYVGRTRQTLKKRQQQHRRIPGRENWELELDRSGLTKDEAHGREQILYDEFVKSGLLQNERRPLGPRNARYEQIYNTGKRVR